MIHGPVGTGKSYAMCCLYRAFRVPQDRPASVLWYDAGELLSKIASCRTSPTGSITLRLPDGTTSEQFEGNFMSKIDRAALLCLDDVGVVSPTSARLEIFKRIIDLREDKPTILTTNLEPEQFIDAFDERTYSRIFSGAVVTAEGEDRRFEWRDMDHGRS